MALTSVVCDEKGNHEDGHNVCFVDGHIEFVSDEDFQQMMAEFKKSEALKKAMER